MSRSGGGSGNSRLSGTSGGLSRGSVRNSGNVVKGGMNILLFIITILLGFGMYILSKTIFRVMEDIAPWPVIIGLIFALLFLVLNFIIMGWIRLTGDFISNKLFAENGKCFIPVALPDGAIDRYRY